MKYARIHDGIVYEFLTPAEGFTIEQCFHPDIHEKCVPVPNDQVKIGWTYVDGAFVEPINEYTTAQIASLTTQQVEALTTQQIASLSTAQVDAMTTSELASLTTTQVSALSTADIASLTTAQVSSLA